MELIVDANELFSAIIAKGRGIQTKKLDILFSEKTKLFAPSLLFKELNKQKNVEEISTHAKDTLYFAAALKKDCPIWSGEKRLKEQSRVEVFNTKELVDKFSLE